MSCHLHSCSASPSAGITLPHFPHLAPPLPQSRRYDSQTTTFSPDGACALSAALWSNRPSWLTIAATASIANVPCPPFPPARPCPHPRPPSSPPSSSTCALSGRLYQVEYAIAAIQHAPPAVAVRCDEGVVIAAERRVTSKLLAPPKSSEKLYKIDDHIAAVIAGETILGSALLEICPGAVLLLGCSCQGMIRTALFASIDTLSRQFGGEAPLPGRAF